jgi:hypothetical protein
MAIKRKQEFLTAIIFTGVKNIIFILGLCAFVAGAIPAASKADGQSMSPPTVRESSVAASSTNTRYGLFDWLDHRSAYGQGIFPEPFLVDDSDLEPNEARLDWLHTKGNNQQSDSAKIEVEKGFGLLTLELELPYQRDVSDGQTSQGFGNISLGARYPLYQFVSGNGFVDSTFGAAMEVGIPVNSAVSKNAELVPKVFNDLRLGNHFTLQSVLGHSTLLGPAPDGGTQTFEYAFVFGCTIPRKELQLPDVQEFIRFLN